MLSLQTPISALNDIMGKQINNYTICEFINKGSFGKVYKVIDDESRNFAIKMFEINNDNINEIELQSSINCVNTLGVVDFFEKENISYIVTELCSHSLYDIILGELKQNSIKCSFFFNVIKSITNGLIHIHNNLIIHRDIKLENILFTYDGVVKIADFGSAIRLNNINSRIIGSGVTFDYSAPEMFKNEGYSFKADIWALGVVLYEMLFRNTPFGRALKLESVRLILSGTYDVKETLDKRFKRLLSEIFIVDDNNRINAKELYKLISHFNN